MFDERSWVWMQRAAESDRDVQLLNERADAARYLIAGCADLLYETMVYWGTAEESPLLAEHVEFPQRINLELAETKTFGSRVVYLRYRRVPDVL